MKNFLLVALMTTFASSAFAQLMTGKSAAYAKEPSRNWAYIYVQYNPGTFSPKDGDSQSFNAFSFGSVANWSLSKKIPLYLDMNYGLQYSFFSEDQKTLGIKTEESFNMLSLKYALGVNYKYDIPNTPIAIVPNAGIDLRVNFLAERKLESDGNSMKYNLFSSDDMGGSDYTWNIVQVGAHVGVNALIWQKLLVGVSYQFDFTEIAKDLHMNQVNLTLGYSF